MHLNRGCEFSCSSQAKIISIAAGENTCAAIGNDGALYTWGKNFMNGGLGHGERRGEKQPKLVKALAGKFVTK